MQLGLIFYQLLTLIFNFLSTVDSGSGWLRFCASGETFKANPSDCAGGYWLKRTTSPQCICAHGVWALSKGYCDPNFAIVVGNEGTCFALSVEVRWVRLIGDPDNPFSPYYFLSNKHFDRIDQGSIASSTRKILTNEIYVGAINPRRSFQDVDGTTCVRPQKAIFVSKNGSVDGNDITTGLDDDDSIQESNPETFNFVPVQQEGKTWSFEQIDICGPNSEDFTYFSVVGNQQFYQYMEPIDAYSISNTCNSTCTEDNEWPEFDQLPIPIVGTKNIESDPTSKDTEDRLAISDEITCIDWDKLPNKTRIELLAQTKRLANTQINYALFRQKSPEVILTEYKLFQKSRRILEKVCSKTEVPPLFLRGVMRMFRHALNESFETYPYLQRGDETENTRIMDTLQKCYNRPLVQAMEFKYNESSCPRKFQYVLYMFNKDAPKPEDKMKPVDNYVRYNLQFNTTKFDYVIETAWKVVMFTHYFCAQDFKDIGFDHSRYLVKMSQLFNQEIIYRWNNPGKSYDSMKYLFRLYDLEKIATGLDHCTGAARSISQYREWIYRPKFTHYCDEAKGLTTSVVPSLTPENRIRNGIINNNGTWNGKAHCLKNWMDPMTLVTGYKQEAIRSCTKENSEHIFNMDEM